jgi:hypothetical protein
VAKRWEGDLSGKSELSAIFGMAKLPAVSTFTWESESDCATLSPGAQDMLGVASPISTGDFFQCIHPEDRVRFRA